MTHLILICANSLGIPKLQPYKNPLKRVPRQLPLGEIIVGSPAQLHALDKAFWGLDTLCIAAIKTG